MNRNHRIALIPGDGIGPEVTSEAVAVLEALGEGFTFTPLVAGGRGIDETGEPLPASTLAAARECGAVLLGAVGGPKWDGLPGHRRPERALLGLRAGLGVFANLRPAYLMPQLRNACPLKEEVLKAGGPPHGEAGFDLLIVRELTGGLYFGEQGRRGDTAFDTEIYSRAEIERALRAGYHAAAQRRRKLCVVDKANVLETSRLWRETAETLAPEYPHIETSYMYVDNCAMQLIRAPARFDVVVTSNLFGDILSDEASALTGSIGMLPSASLGEPRNGYPVGIYEPIHGSAPDLAGKDWANPLGAILSAGMLLRYSFGMEEAARRVERAVAEALGQGLRTRDIAGHAPDERVVGTKEMGEAVRRRLAAP